MADFVDGDDRTAETGLILGLNFGFAVGVAGRGITEGGLTVELALKRAELPLAAAARAMPFFYSILNSELVDSLIFHRITETRYGGRENG